MARARTLALAALVLALPLAGTALGETKITIINADAAGFGFNDPAPRSPVGGNPGTTLGEQRLNVFKYAAAFWGQRISSPVEILVRANFFNASADYPCSASSAVLGFASTVPIWSDFEGAPRANTWYSSALANKLAGVDLFPAGSDVDYPNGEDIGAQFTASLDDGSCAFPTKWYYGLDANAPVGTEDFATVVIHELAHGLGFQSFVTRTTGGRLAGDDGVARDDAFMAHLWDATAGKGWPEMTDAERLASITNTGGLVWNGPAVVAVAGSVLSAGVGSGGRVQMYAPNPSEKGSSVSHWDTAVSPSETMEPYYTGPKHDLLVTDELMSDLGWSLASGSPVYTWLLPSSAKTGGAFGAVWTTTLYLGNRGSAEARYRIKFLGNNADGTAGPETPELSLPSSQTITYEDVLGTVFSKESGSYGAIRVTANVPTLNVLGMTSTPVPPQWAGCVSSGGYGLSIPAFQASDMITAGTLRSIVGIRNDGAYRTNLVLANAGASEVVVTGTLLASGSAVLGTKTWTLPPLGMTQGSDTLAGQMGILGSFRDAQLLLTTSTPGGAFAAYATVIDNATNDARTLLPR